MLPERLFHRPRAQPALDGLPSGFSCNWTDGGGGTAWVQPEGELDIVTAPHLDEALRAAQAAAERVVLDLRGVRFLDSSAVHPIIQASARAVLAEGRLTVIQGPPSVKRVFELTKVDEVVDIVDLPGAMPAVHALSRPA